MCAGRRTRTGKSPCHVPSTRSPPRRRSWRSCHERRLHVRVAVPLRVPVLPRGRPRAGTAFASASRRSVRTSGSAFSWIVIPAVVWGTYATGPRSRRRSSGRGADERGPATSARVAIVDEHAAEAAARVRTVESGRGRARSPPPTQSRSASLARPARSWTSVSRRAPSRGARRSPEQALERPPLGGGEGLVLSERGREPPGEPAVARARVAERRRERRPARAAGPSPGQRSGVTRFATRPAIGIDSACRRSWNASASSTEIALGEATSTNPTSGCESSACTAAARSLKPSYMPWKPWRKSPRSRARPGR